MAELLELHFFDPCRDATLEAPPTAVADCDYFEDATSSGGERGKIAQLRAIILEEVARIQTGEQGRAPAASKESSKEDDSTAAAGAGDADEAAAAAAKTSSK
jgi:hypothetical protein